MADVPGGPVRTVVEFAVRPDEAAADAGVDQDVHQGGAVGRQGPGFAECHEVHVVVDDDRALQMLAQAVAHRERVPARHDRGADRPAQGDIDGPRQADRHGQHSGRPDLGEHAVERVGEDGQ
jgi:hypothetical protein